MRNIFVTATALAFCLPIMAQETYESARLANVDLNGTARYVGMGGAMEALGADISTIATNPAGIGLFRRSVVNGSFGLVADKDASSVIDANKASLSFDQLGFVYSMRSGRQSSINIALNYHKSKNFKYILSVADRLNGASQGKLSYAKGYAGVFNVGQNNDGTYIGYDSYGNPSLAFNQLDYFYYNSTMSPDGDGNIYYDEASQYMFNRADHGYIGEYNLNISGNEKDRFYWGLTVGLHDVHYKGHSVYQETYVDNGGGVVISDKRKITGNGYDVKLGVIVRPVEASPFRIGAYVHTPTWYNLTTRNNTHFNATLNGAASGQSNASANAGNANHQSWMGESYDFKFYTPWKFGLSLGHTVGNYLALGATYEYADYGSCDNRVIDGGYYDEYWGDYQETSSSDGVMKHHTKQTLKGVSMLKVGLEYKPIAGLNLRLGYNYLSPMYSKTGFKDGSLFSYGSYYSSATDYTNWKSTNRLTAGVGYAYKKWNFDLACQYSSTNGDFSPFMSYYPDQNDDQSLVNDPGSAKVSQKRKQLILTVGYRF